MSPETQPAPAGAALLATPGAVTDAVLDVPATVPDAPDAPDALVTPGAVWARVLDELAEMCVGAGPDAAESVIGRLVRWTPPTDLGPLPVELVDRALEVLSGHAHVVDRKSVE